MFTSHHPVPDELAPVFDGATFPEFVAVVMIKTFLDIYNRMGGGEGVGLFQGSERYIRLTNRVEQAAVMSAGDRMPALRSVWGRLTSQLNVPLHSQQHDPVLLELQSLPRGLQSLVARLLQSHAGNLVMLARHWHRSAKMQNPAYVERMRDWFDDEIVTPGDGMTTLLFSAAEIVASGGDRVAIEIPNLTENSVRGIMIRRPIWWHLAAMLGIPAGDPGSGEIPGGVEGIFTNGGNIRAGSKKLPSAAYLGQLVRRTYPSLALIGGVTDSFDLGKSMLDVECYIICRENAYQLEDTPAEDLPMARMSVFDLIDEHTLTRQANHGGEGQMIYGFETLASGTQFLCRFTVRHWANPLVHGALLAALDTWGETARAVGGQSARGFGFARLTPLSIPDGSRVSDLIQQYEDHIEQHADELRAGLLDGTLTTEVSLCS